MKETFFFFFGNTTEFLAGLFGILVPLAAVLFCIIVPICIICCIKDNIEEGEKGEALLKQSERSRNHWESKYYQVDKDKDIYRARCAVLTKENIELQLKLKQKKKK